LSDREPRLQRLRSRRRRRLSDVRDDLARTGVPDGLLRNPRPGTEGTRRGRGVATLDPAPRRIPERLSSSHCHAFEDRRRRVRHGHHRVEEMSMAEGFIHTVYKNDEWVNEFEQGAELGLPHATKEEAVA